MTKQDFIALADALRGADVPPAVLDRICAFCRERNPKFLEGRFRAYLAGECGQNGGTAKVKAGR